MHRHEALRTRIVEVEGVPTQRVEAPERYHLEIVDLTSTDHTQRVPYARELAESFVDEEVDLSSERIFAARLLRLSSSDHVLVLGVDHIVADGVSCTILSDEIWRIYRSFTRGEAHSLAPVRLQFPEFAAWHHAAHTSWVDRHLRYWEDKLRNAECLRMPCDYEGTDPGGAITAVLHVPFGRNLTKRLLETARAVGIKLSLLILSLYCAHIFLRHDHRDVLVTFPMHGRQAMAELRDMIGDLAHCTYLRIEINPAEGLWNLAIQIAGEFAASYARDASQLPPPASLEFPTEFYFNWFSNALQGSAGRGMPSCRGDRELIRQPFQLTSKRPIKFAPNFYHGPSGIVLSIFYRTDLFKGSTMQRIGSDLKCLALQFIEDPRVPLGSCIVPP